MDIASIWSFDLRRGCSSHPRHGACLYDAAFWIAHGQFDRNYPSACWQIKNYAICLNDGMPINARQMLKPFILRVVGNCDSDAEPARLHHIVLGVARRVLPLTFKARSKRRAQVLYALPDDASYEAIKTAIADSRSPTSKLAINSAILAAQGKSILAARVAADTVIFAANDAPTAAARNAAWREAVAVLDGALRIGRQAPEFDEETVLAAVRRFEAARIESIKR